MSKFSIFPKLFVGDACKAFKSQLFKSNYKYEINCITTREELLDFIDLYSSYKCYTLPVILEDISFFNKKDQSLLLKFMDNTNLNLVLLASRDNIIDTIISRVREFRKFYSTNINSNISFIQPSKAREMMAAESSENEDISQDDKLIIKNKFNPILSYNDHLVEKFRKNYKDKLLSLLENQ